MSARQFPHPSRVSRGIHVLVAVLWFRDDLRLSEHAALAAAARAGAVLPVFVRDAAFRVGGAAAWWLHHALADLGARIAAAGGRLALYDGEAGAALAAAAAGCGAREVHALAARIPAERALQHAAAARLAQDGVRLILHPGALLHDPAAIRTGAGTPYAVFTPFWRAFSQGFAPPPALPEPEVRWHPNDGGASLASFGLLPTAPDWAGGLRAAWAVGEAAAEARLEDFIGRRLAAYPADRDRPDKPGTARLSADLRWGQLAPARVWRRVLAATADPAQEAGAWAFLRQLGWREFAHHVLWAHPEMAARNLRPGFEAFPWRDAPGDFRRWARGETGFPLVDAAMKELWSTGWMHNRARMVAASFLVKDLRIDWRRGFAWFDDTLVDADPALDPFSWQWVAGTGADAAPYFRIFNPETQGDKFDPAGDYVRRWLGAPGHAARPGAVVNHAEARRAALAALAVARGGG